MMSPYEIFFDFIEWQAFHEANQQMILRVRRTTGIIKQMQRTVRAYFQIKAAREEALLRRWDAFVEETWNNQSKKKN